MGCPFKKQCVGFKVYPNCACTHTSKLNKESRGDVAIPNLRRALQTYQEGQDEEQTRS